MHFDPIISPKIDQTRPGRNFCTYKGKALLIQDENSVPITLKTEVDFRRSPRCLGVVRTGRRGTLIDVILGNEYRRELVQIGEQGEVYEGLGLKYSFGRTYRAEILLERQLYHDCTARFTEITFGLFNFPEFFYKTGIHHGELRHLELPFGEWLLEVDPGRHDSKLRDASVDQRGYLITTWCRLSRRDGTACVPSDWAVVSGFLYYVLGFLAGRRTTPVFVEGLSDGQEVVWRDLTLMRQGPDRHHGHWFPRPYPQHIPSLVEQFWTLWQDSERREPLKRAIEWYWEISTSEHVTELRLVVAQFSLELLAELILPGPEMSKTEFKGLGVKPKLTKLAGRLGVSLDVPHTFMELKEFDGKEWKECISALVDVRNSLTHLADARHAYLESMPWKARHQLAEWATWFVELSILHVLGYSGRYDSRVALPNKSFPFVPWIDPSQAGAPGNAKAVLE